MTRGIIYVAAGEPYLTEMRQSIISLRNYIPDIPITCYTDVPFEHDYIHENIILEDMVYDFADSILDKDMITYDQVIFLDSDTYICEDISDIFDILDKFDIAAVHNPERRPEFFEDESAYEAQGVPDSFPQYNTGVLGICNNRSAHELLDTWQRIYETTITDEGFTFNQPAFREALYKTDVSIATLPSEYNVRTNRCGYLNGPVKILHGRHPEMGRVEKKLNESTMSRVYTLQRYPVHLIPHEVTLKYRLLRAIKRDGVLDTLKQVIRFVTT
jgi:hypothetical protein